MLDVGAGTGKASVPIAAWGWELVALEPAPSMAAVARRNLAPYPNAEIVVARFEDWEPDRLFDLLISGQALHWVRPDARYAKAAGVLGPGGTLAAFWNAPVLPDDDRDFEIQVQDVYRAQAPELAHRGEFATADTVRDRAGEIIESGRFTGVEVRRYPWSWTLGREEYVGLLRTHSPHASLDADRRSCLLAGIGELIDAEFGGRVRQHYVAVLHLARKT